MVGKLMRSFRRFSGERWTRGTAPRAAMRILATLVVFCSEAHAQDTGAQLGQIDPCGPLNGYWRQSLLEHYVGVFTDLDAEAAQFRTEMRLEVVSQDERIAVVSEAGECVRVVEEAFRIENEEIVPGPAPVSASTMEWAVLRMGPYLVVPLSVRETEGITVHQWGHILIFKAADLSFVGWFLG